MTMWKAWGAPGGVRALTVAGRLGVHFSPQAVPMSERAATLLEPGSYPRFHRAYHHRPFHKNKNIFRGCRHEVPV